MPRTPRKSSPTDYYHIMQRGVNRHTIFFDEEDYLQFFHFLDPQRKQYNCKITAWCLMPNHTHFAVKGSLESISKMLQGFGAAFVYWYNRKYERTGMLFERRYKSEPVMNEIQLQRLIRYIHLNPVAKHICEKPEDYPYSSYRRYFIDDYFPENHLFFGEMTKEEFIEYHIKKVTDHFLDI